MSDLAALIARLEAAEHGSFALDRQIWRAVVPERFVHEDDKPPAYTVSLDAALTLVDGEGFWRLGHDGAGPNPGDFLAEIWPAKGATQRARHASAALALVIAAIKARAA